MLKAHQACIDLEKGVLRIQGREVKFLAEHELPDKAKEEMDLASTAGAASSPPAGPSSVPQQRPFPGAGQTLGTAPQPGRGRGVPVGGASASQPQHSEHAISALMALGASRDVAISKLNEAGGNLEYAASLLF